MSALGPTLQAFFTDRLVRERNASPRTIAAYRDTWRLLLGFASQQTGKPPAALDFNDIDVVLVGALLDHLEIPFARAMLASPPSTPCSATLPCIIPSTSLVSAACSPSGQSASGAL